MRKIFNKKRVSLINERLYSSFGTNPLRCSGTELALNFSWRKTDNILFAETAYKLSENKEEMIKKFFPVKYSQLENDGRPFTTLRFYYESDIEKLRWVVQVEDVGKKVYLLRTTAFDERVPVEAEKARKEIKETISKLYGFWLVHDEEETYITDMSHSKGGYRKILSIRNNSPRFYSHAFCTPEEWDYIKDYILTA